MPTPISYRDIFPSTLRHAPLDSLFLKPGIRGHRRISSYQNGFSSTACSRLRAWNAIFAKVWPTNTFQSLGVDLFIVGTQLNESRKVIFCKEDFTTKDKSVIYSDFATVSDAVAASAALPPVFSPYPIKNRNGEDMYFCDGEIRDTMSTQAAADHGADLIISSCSIQPYHYTCDGEPPPIRHTGDSQPGLYPVIQQKIEYYIKARKSWRPIKPSTDIYAKSMWLTSSGINFYRSSPREPAINRARITFTFTPTRTTTIYFLPTTLA